MRKVNEDGVAVNNASGGNIAGLDNNPPGKAVLSFRQFIQRRRKKKLNESERNEREQSEERRKTR